MSALKELVERRDASQKDLEELVRNPDGTDRELTGDQEVRTAQLLKDIDELDQRIDEESQLEERRQKLSKARGLLTIRSDVSVLEESAMYGPNSRHSHYADYCASQMYDEMHPRGIAARSRLREWSHQVEREVALGSKEGRSAERQIMSNVREAGINPHEAVREARSRGRASLEEKRTGITTGGGATASAAGGGGAAFVSPVFYLTEYAPYREFGRAFADQVTKQPLPDYGMDVYIPAVTGPAGIAAQTEGSGVQETDPTAGYLSAQIATLAGQVTVSQQLLDRAGPGFAFDRMIFDQLNRDYAPKLDNKVLTTALSGAGAISYTGTFAVTATSGATNSLYSKISAAKVAIRTTAGTVLNPTHVFFQPSRWEYVVAWGDASARPIVVPDYAGPFNAAAAGSDDGDSGIEGNTGYRINGLRAFSDANIPVPGSGADQVIVGDLSEVHLFEGQPVTRAVPQTLANNLQVLLQLYNYVAVIVRYPLAIQAISGTALAGITF